MTLPADWDVEELMIPHALRCDRCRHWVVRWRARWRHRGDPGE
jgi:hypothetical protein